MFTTRARVVLVCTAALCVALAAVAFAADKPKPSESPGRKAAATTEDKKADAAHDAAMDEMMKYMMPGPAHEKLKGMAGRWKATVKSWTGGPEPQVSEGVADMKMILGGRYLEQIFTGSMMNQPYEGQGLTGYDMRKGEYTMLWVDNMSTAMMTGSGAMDDSKKELTMKGVAEGPEGKPVEYRMITKNVDDNTVLFSMYAPLQGKDTLLMEITYTRIP